MGGHEVSREVCLSISNIHKSFGDNEVLKGIDLDIHKGEVVAMIGRSGSGKSTLLRCINLIEQPDRGVIKVNGFTYDCAAHKRHSRKQAAAIRKRCTMVFQEFNLFPHRSVLRNVTEGPVRVQRVSRHEAEELGMALLARVGVTDKARERPSSLSGGQKQRVAIARALALKPTLMLFDEPTSALDPELVGEVLNVMRKLAQEGMTMIVATHEIAFARDVCNRVIYLDYGRILEQGPPEQVFGSPKEESTRKFLEAVLS